MTFHRLQYENVALEYLQFAVSCVHDKHDSVHSEGGLSDVCRHDAFPHTIWSLAEDTLQGSQLCFITRTRRC